MNKYELALVVNAKLEEEERNAVVEKAKAYVTSNGGTLSEVEKQFIRELTILFGS